MSVIPIDLAIAFVDSMGDTHDRLTECLIALIHIEPIHKQHIQAEAEPFRQARHPHRPAMGLSIDIEPPQDDYQGRSADEPIKEPIGERRRVEVERHLCRIRIEEPGEGLDGEQIDKHHEEQYQQHRRGYLP